METKKKPEYEAEILRLLKARDADKTICPSEVLSGAEKKNSQKMEEVREAARRLVSQGKIVISQKGHVVDPATAKGPIRLKRV